MRFEKLEPKLCLATYAMVPHTIESMHTYQDASLVDFDQDGRLDLLSSELGGGINLMLGREGRAFEVQQSIYDSGQLVSAVKVDLDEAIDLVLVESEGLVWLQHDLDRHQLNRRLISSDVRSAEGLLVGDIDRNGVIDFVFSNSSESEIRILMGSVADDGNLLWDSSSLERKAPKLVLTDADGDHDLDLVQVSSPAWLHAFNEGHFSEPQLLTGMPNRPAIIEDLDSDGQLDVVTFDARFELNGMRFERQHEIDNFWNDKLKSVVTDWNDDGRKDVVWEIDVSPGPEAADFSVFLQRSDGSLAPPIYLFQAPQTYQDWQIVTTDTGTKEVMLFGGDGTLTGRSTSEVSVYVNPRRFYWSIVGLNNQRDFVAIGERSSILVAAANLFEFYRYRLDDAEAIQSTSLTSLLDEREGGVLQGDFNGDGNDDVIAWDINENVTLLGNDSGGFSDVVRRVFTPPQSELLALNLDQDASTEVISRDRFGTGAEVSVHNLSRRGTTWRKSLLFVVGENAELEAADIDRDGLVDLVISDTNGLSWRRQETGGAFSDPLHISNQQGRILVSDIDGDGQVDIVVFDRYAAVPVTWFSNEAGAFRRIPTDLVIAPEFHHWAGYDVDNDGDQDFVVKDAEGIRWASNTDGRGTFGPLVSLVKTTSPSNFAPVDVDGDGDLDLVTSPARFELTWYERRLLGDADGDGRFDSADLVQIFTRGHYEAEGYRAVSYDDGDFNFDGKVDSSDLVAAFVG